MRVNGLPQPNQSVFEHPLVTVVRPRVQQEFRLSTRTGLGQWVDLARKPQVSFLHLSNRPESFGLVGKSLEVITQPRLRFSDEL